MRGQGETTRTWRATRWLVVAALVLGVAGVPSPAEAATSWWTDIARLGGDEPSIEEMHDVVLTHDGRLLLVYSTATALRARFQSADGSWGLPTDLVVGGVGDVSTVVAPAATYVVWSGAGGVDIARLDGAAWTPLTSLGGVGFPEHMDAAPTPEGDVAVAWSRSLSMPEDSWVYAATFDGASWSAPSTTEVRGIWRGAAVAVAPDGTRVVAIEGRAGDGGTSTSMQVHVLTADGSGWSAPRLISSRSASFDRDGLVSTSDGAALLVSEESASGDAVAAVATFSDGTWNTTRLVGGRSLSPRRIAVGPDGRAQVAVGVNENIPDFHAEIRTYRHLGGASWSAPETAVSIRGSWDRESLGMAIGADGTALVASGFFEPFDPFLVVSLRGPGRPWQQPSAHGNHQGHVAEVYPVIEPDGMVHLVWRSGTGQWFSTSGFVVPFDDLVPGAFYVWPVLWAAEVGLTTGVGGADEFQPNRSITRAEAITTLWRYAGSPPAPAAGFSDTAANAFYSPAVNWARHTGLTTGVAGSNRFEPNRTITRAELVTLLWRFDGSKGAPAGGFADVPSGAFFAPAVNWAKSVGITTGVGGTNRFEPNREVTRAEAFTFVYRLAASVDLSIAATEQPPLGLESAEPID